MAGICGYILKDKTPSGLASQSMLENLGLSEKYSAFFENDERVFVGQKNQLNFSRNGNFEKLDDHGLKIVYEGLIFIEDKTKKIIIEKYLLNPSLDNELFLPFLYLEFGKEMVHKISGWYNIVIYNSKIYECLIFNDKLGYLPLFIYQDDHVFIFSSKIESILSSGLMQSIEFDQVSILEHQLFNYTISEKTLIKNIETLPPSTLISFQNEIRKYETYWIISELFKPKPLSKKQSLIEFNAALRNAVDKVFTCDNESINFSFTGGWDSRVLLSYLMKYKDRLNLYSFGAADSPDITIPQKISKSLGLKYSPYVLDENYLQNDFGKFAQETILKSNGSRNYKRAHYLFAISKIGQNSTVAIAGIFGDEVLKIAGPKGGNVISKNAVDFISSNYDLNSLKQKIADLNYLKDDQVLLDEFFSRMEVIKNQVSDYTLNQKYYHFRFIINLRKYFGAEVNSYNDYVNSYSPFIDADFLKTYFKSWFCGIYHPFNSNSLSLKRQTTKLYSDLVKLNYPQLAYFETDRGYTFSDVSGIFGSVKIAFMHLINKKKLVNVFFTDGTKKLFEELVINTRIPENYSKKFKLNLENTNEISLCFWMAEIQKKYNLEEK